MRDNLPPSDRHLLAERRREVELKRAEEILEFGLRELDEEKEIPCSQETRSLL